jgi:hypothetical protein
MQIFAFSIIDFAKQPPFYQLSDQDKGLEIIAVFTHHVDLSGSFAGRCQQPAFFQGNPGRYFRHDMQAVLQRQNRLGGMKGHWRSDHHGIEIRPGQHVFIIQVFFTRLHLQHGLIQPFGINVANSVDSGQTVKYLPRPAAPTKPMFNFSPTFIFRFSSYLIIAAAVPDQKEQQRPGIFKKLVAVNIFVWLVGAAIQ